MTAGRSDNDLTRLGLWLVLGFWLLTPWVVIGDALDGASFLTAARLPELAWLSDADWDAGYCAVNPTDCETSPPFYSAPPVIPIMQVLDIGGQGILTLRLAMTVCLVVAFAMMARVAGSTLVLAVALVATPMVVHNVVVGQTTPLLVLSAAAGLGGLAWWRGLVWAAAGWWKLFPALLVVVVRRRPVIAAWALGFTAVAFLMSYVILGSDIGSRFLGSLDVWTAGDRESNRYLLSIHEMGARTGVGLVAVVGSWLLVAGTWWLRARHLPKDVEWAWAWAAAVVLTPNVWPHSFLLALPFLVRLPSRWAWGSLVFVVGWSAAAVWWGHLSPLMVLAPVALLAVVVVGPVVVPLQGAPGSRAASGDQSRR